MREPMSGTLERQRRQAVGFVWLAALIGVVYSVLLFLVHLKLSARTPAGGLLLTPQLITSVVALGAAIGVMRRNLAAAWTLLSAYCVFTAWTWVAAGQIRGVVVVGIVVAALYRGVVGVRECHGWIAEYDTRHQAATEHPGPAA